MFGTDRDVYVPRQLYQLGGTPGVECHLLPPAAGLGSTVHYHWVLDISAERVELPVIPDNALDLVLCPAPEDFAALYFPVERAFTITLEGPISYVGTCLRLGRLGDLFTLGADELRALSPGNDTIEALELGPLIGRLGQSEDHALIGRCLDEFVRSRGRRARERRGEGGGAASGIDPSLFERFLDALEPGRVAELARQVGVSERQLRRETHRLFGLAPKKIQRIVRLQRAIAELVDDAPPIADYHDDSHRIRELRALTGWTPGEIRRLAEKYNTRCP